MERRVECLGVPDLGSEHLDAIFPAGGRGGGHHCPLSALEEAHKVGLLRWREEQKVDLAAPQRIELVPPHLEPERVRRVT